MDVQFFCLACVKQIHWGTSWDSDDGLVNGKKELCFWNRPVRNCLIHAWSMLPSSEVTLLERLVYFMSVLLLLSIALMNLVSWLQTEPWILEEWVWGCGWCISLFPDAKRGEIAHHWTKVSCISQRYKHRWLDLDDLGKDVFLAKNDPRGGQKVTLKSPPSLRDWTLLPFFEKLRSRLSWWTHPWIKQHKTKRLWKLGNRHVEPNRTLDAAKRGQLDATPWDLWFTKVFLYWTSVPSIAKL